MHITTDTAQLVTIDTDSLDRVDGGYDYSRTLHAAGQGALTGAKVGGAFGAGWGAAAGSTMFGAGVLPGAVALGTVGAVSGGVAGGVGAAATDAWDQLRGR